MVPEICILQYSYNTRENKPHRKKRKQILQFHYLLTVKYCYRIQELTICIFLGIYWNRRTVLLNTMSSFFPWHLFSSNNIFTLKINEHSMSLNEEEYRGVRLWTSKQGQVSKIYLQQQKLTVTPLGHFSVFLYHKGKLRN